MKPITLSILIFLFLPAFANAQLTDTALIKRLSIKGTCLCNTTLMQLQQSMPDLKQIDVEEMDLPKGCYGQDSRYVAGVGYASAEQPGMIFQKDPQSDFISKIRLTKPYRGKLPNGSSVDLSKLMVKDLFKLYPSLKGKWGSRGCSTYWNISNDTISFYVKIDSLKKPQYPIDEVYYSSKQVEAIDLVASCYSFQADKPEVILEDSNDPIFFIDSIRVNKTVLQSYDPNEIASITVYKDSSAVKRMGSAAKNGLIYIETKHFAKMRYWEYFKSKSEQYAKIVPSAENDSNVQYILNNKVLTTSFEGDLASINDAVFRSIRVIDKQQLKAEYKVSDKEVGVVITSATPGNLHNGKKKFGN